MSDRLSNRFPSMYDATYDAVASYVTPAGSKRDNRDVALTTAVTVAILGVATIGMVALMVATKSLWPFVIYMVLLAAVYGIKRVSIEGSR